MISKKPNHHQLKYCLCYMCNGYAIYRDIMIKIFLIKVPIVFLSGCTDSQYGIFITIQLGSENICRHIFILSLKLQ